ncbi:hypothetical protein PENSPDRAFT_687599 [Peniophora sp. CONT]|nr:hypothetical protein PENSPDRAFT_687599 [Peniophora sp. CONT]
MLYTHIKTLVFLSIGLFATATASCIIRSNGSPLAIPNNIPVNGVLPNGLVINPGTDCTVTSTPANTISVTSTTVSPTSQSLLPAPTATTTASTTGTATTTTTSTTTTPASMSLCQRMSGRLTRRKCCYMYPGYDGCHAPPSFYSVAGIPNPFLTPPNPSST